MCIDTYIIIALYISWRRLGVRLCDAAAMVVLPSACERRLRRAGSAATSAHRGEPAPASADCRRRPRDAQRALPRRFAPGLLDAPSVSRREQKQVGSVFSRWWMVSVKCLAGRHYQLDCLRQSLHLMQCSMPAGATIRMSAAIGPRLSFWTLAL